MQLRISEIFCSIQGEASRAGLPTVFVRLTGCPLRCVWCDTEYAFEGGERVSLSSILEQVASYRTPHVTVTGGEPLAQPDCHQLMRELCDGGFDVSLETSGALPVEEVDPRVSLVMDLKCPASGESARNRWQNLSCLASKDEIKFVIANREDYEWSKAKLFEHNLSERVGEVLFSPVEGQLQPAELAGWIVQDALPVRFQLQLHKILWQDARGR